MPVSRPVQILVTCHYFLVRTNLWIAGIRSKLSNSDTHDIVGSQVVKLEVGLTNLSTTSTASDKLSTVVSMGGCLSSWLLMCVDGYPWCVL